MRQRLTRILLILLAGVAVAIPILWACAPEGPSLAFTWANRPDLPLNGFAAGRLGVLQPTYARSYLVVAYRQLQGTPLTETETQGALDLWEARVHGGVAWPAQPEPARPAAPDGALDWARTRARFTRQPAPAPARYRWDETFYRPNVTEHALEVAAATLRDRAQRWRPDLVEEWIRAQDAVFASNGRTQPALEPAPADRDPLFQRDRAYQVACARFYAGDFAAARAAFTAISQDPASPWCRLSGYLLGRVWLQEGLGRKDPTTGPGPFLAARAAFQAVRAGTPAPGPAPLAAEPMPPGELQEAAAVGERRALALGDPPAAARAMAGELLRPGASADFGDLLGRYTNLLDANITGESAADGKARAIAPGLLEEDLTEWLFRFRDTGPRAYALACARWAERKTLPWLLLALMTGEAEAKGVQALLTAAAQVPPTSPGYESVAFHRARLLAAQGRRDEAQRIATAFLEGDPRHSTPSSQNLWRALRMPLAQDGQAFLADALRTPAGVYGFGGEATPAAASLATASSGVQAAHPEVQHLLQGVQPAARFLQGDAAKVLNLSLPTELLGQFAQAPGLPRHLRREWLRAAWVRAVLLERWGLAADLTPALLSQEPELRPSLAGFVQASAEERPRQALLTLLRHPGLRWMVFQGINRRTFTEPGEKPLPLRQRDTFLGACWWPAPNEGQNAAFQEQPDGAYSWGPWYYYPQPHAMEAPLFALAGGRVPALPWLSAAQRARGEREGRTLMALAAGPDWLAEHTLAWALAAPDDPRIPEALHHAVRAEKVGGSQRLGVKCFRLLHRRYPGTPWAARTPIHY